MQTPRAMVIAGLYFLRRHTMEKNVRRNAKHPSTVEVLGRSLFGGLGRNRTTDTRIFNRHPRAQPSSRHTQILAKTSTYSAVVRNETQSDALKSTYSPT